jgi:hypothetical protein
MVTKHDSIRIRHNVFSLVFVSVFFRADYLTDFSVLRPHTADDRMIDECGTVCGIRIRRGNRNTRRTFALVSLYPPQIAHDMTWD